MCCMNGGGAAGVLGRFHKVLEKVFRVCGIKWRESVRLLGMLHGFFSVIQKWCNTESVFNVFYYHGDKGPTTAFILYSCVLLLYLTCTPWPAFMFHGILLVFFFLCLFFFLKQRKNCNAMNINILQYKCSVYGKCVFKWLFLSKLESFWYGIRKSILKWFCS